MFSCFSRRWAVQASSASSDDYEWTLIKIKFFKKVPDSFFWNIFTSVSIARATLNSKLLGCRSSHKSIDARHKDLQEKHQSIIYSKTNTRHQSVHSLISTRTFPSSSIFTRIGNEFPSLKIRLKSTKSNISIGWMMKLNTRSRIDQVTATHQSFMAWFKRKIDAMDVEVMWGKIICGRNSRLNIDFAIIFGIHTTVTTISAKSRIAKRK